MNWLWKLWWLGRRGLSIAPHAKYEGLWSVTGSTGRVGTGRSPRHALMWHWISNLEPEGLEPDPSPRSGTRRCSRCSLPWSEHPSDNRDPTTVTRIACDGRLFPVQVCP